MSGDIVLSAGVRSNILALQRTADLMTQTQQRLSTGKKVNSAIDNPTNFFTAAALNNRAGDLGRLLDSVGNAIKTLEAADTGIESIKKLVVHEQPAESLVGILLAIVSLIVMPVLAWQKRKVAAQIHSRALAADALETLACSYLSFTLLLGIGLNAWLGWWWADPFSALAMVFFLLREGWEAIEEGWESPR